MTTPPLMLAAAIGFWGWQSNQLVLAILLALVLESPRLVPNRYDFTQKDLNRASDLCALVCLLLAVYFFLTQRSSRAIFLTVQWLPVVFAPLALIQGYHTADRLNVSGFFMVIRRKYPDGRPSGPFVDFSYPYLALCLLGASTANIASQSFYAGLVCLSGVLLWQARTVRFGPLVWGGALGLAIFLGYAGHIGLHHLQLFIEDKGVEWFVDSIRKERDPFRSATAMGDVGRLKQSHEILYRVTRTRGVAVPMLLRGASFNTYRNGIWYARRAPFKQALTPADDGRTWWLAADRECDRTIYVAGQLRAGRGTLPLPAGTVRLGDLPAARVARNRFGAIRVEGGPELVNYAVCFQSGHSGDGLPGQDDLQVPAAEQKVIRALVSAWDLAGRSEQHAARVIKEKFATEFTYTLELQGRYAGQTPLTDFLTRTRSGHCEYFGTATVLMLRTLGIPARYVSGYSVQEMDPWSKDLLIRSRHAHAWAQAYIGGQWVTLDTTPVAWAELESATAGFWQPAADLWAWVRFRVIRWLQAGREQSGGIRQALLWALAAGLVILAGLIFRKKRAEPKDSAAVPTEAPRPLPGQDSPFYLVQSRVADWGFRRAPSEPLTAYIERVARAQPDKRAALARLEPLLAWHYRYRFDPQAAGASDKASFRQAALQWLEETTEKTTEPS
jgi:transglutaminase-like putative cysteine protease